MNEQSEKAHGQIMMSLGRLEGNVQGINTHLATLNGTVAKHEGQLKHIEVEDGKLGVFLDGLKVQQKQEKSFRSKWLDRILMLIFMGILQVSALLLIRSGIINLETTPKSPEEIKTRVIEINAELEKLKASTDTADQNSNNPH